MIYIVCLLVGVGSGLWCSLKYDEVVQRIRQRREWDAATGEALAVVNDAADEDRAFAAWMRKHGADQ